MEDLEIIVDNSTIDTIQISEQTVSRETIVVNIAEEPRLSIPIPDHSNRPKKELPKQSSLGTMMKEIHKEVITGKEENKIDLSAETVVLIWKEFLVEHKDKLQNAFLGAAIKQTPHLVGEKITFTETNNISLELLQLHKLDILSFFRKRTTNINTSLDFKLQRNESNQKTYKTKKDRLKDMITENSSVLKLIEKLDLNEY